MSHSRRLDANRGQPLTFSFDGEPVRGYAGETLAAALLAHGVTAFGYTRTGQPRQPFCNMGTCFDCAVVVDGVPLIRSCLTPAQEGMDVRPWRNA